MTLDIQDDLRQSVVIAKNEVRKFLSGKKIYVFSALMGLIILLLAIVPYILGEGYDDATEITIIFASFIMFIVMLAGVMFTATSIVSEYEERTALILFTRPIRKSSIFLGKLMASMLVVSAYVLIYYAFIIIYSFALMGEVEGDLAVSFGLCICAVFGVSGLSMLLSSVSKKGSTASILTLVFILLILSILSSVLSGAGINDDWILSKAMESISASLGSINEGGHISGSTIDVGYNAGVLIGWGVVCSAISYLIFRKREF